MSKVSEFLPEEGDGLLVVDLQYDFVAGGALAVPGGDEVAASRMPGCRWSTRVTGIRPITVRSSTRAVRGRLIASRTPGAPSSSTNSGSETTPS